MMGQTVSLLQKELQNILLKKEPGRSKPLYGIFLQSQMLIHEYAQGRKKKSCTCGNLSKNIDVLCSGLL
ncbi:hypothetical protein PROCOU_11783 [Listeria rocourtiae FSL F6-920]|nr:hypothetical protein PROCOU_11783 [Listeria rocourtiae FSL F6-920]